MKFYGMKFEEVEQMPIRIFWVSFHQMNRIKAAENLRWARNLSVANMTDEGRRSFVDQETQAMGVVAEEEPQLDREGLQKLKQIA
jgi:hypothetical protein